MNKKLLGVLAGLSISIVSSTQLAAEEPVKWGYQGRVGADYWGELSPDFALCSRGKNQSPVNINTNEATDIKQAPLVFDYSMLIPDKIKHTGNSIQVDVGLGNSVKIDGETFNLQYFNFHSPSEHTVNGKRFPFEAHFVHKNRDGELLVVAMMFIPGLADSTLTELWKQMPRKAGDENRLGAKTLQGLESEMKVSNYYRLNGSLTTPPCTEGVRWFVLKTPMTISAEQLHIFETTMGHTNNRPVQKLNARLILE